MQLKNLYILGTRGIPAAHGGFETFAQDLASYMTEQDWNVTVYCQGSENKTDLWQNIRRITIKAPDSVWGTGLFDFKSIIDCLRQQDGVWLVLGYNTGFFNLLPRLLGRKQIINMDGIEWRRAKWSWFYKAAFFFNYFCATIAGNKLIADNPGIQDVLSYHAPLKDIVMIPYGAEKIQAADIGLLTPYHLTPNEYALVIARPEPENSILEIVRAWSYKSRHKKLVVLGHFDDMHPYHQQIKNAASSEVLFMGALYHKETVQALRYHASVYIHGHTVGGTNPSLVEALAAGNAVIAHDNVFNRWTAGKAALYFNNESNLRTLLNDMSELTFETLKQESIQRHQEAFLQETIMKSYHELIESI